MIKHNWNQLSESTKKAITADSLNEQANIATRGQDVLEAIRSHTPFKTHGSLTGMKGQRDSGSLGGDDLKAFNEMYKSIDYSVYSYSTPIAWYTRDGWFVVSQKFSATTSKQQSVLRRALVSGAGYFRPASHSLSASMGESVVGSSLRVQGLNEQGGGDTLQGLISQLMTAWGSGRYTWDAFVTWLFNLARDLGVDGGELLAEFQAQLPMLQPHTPPTGGPLIGELPKWNQLGTNPGQRPHNYIPYGRPSPNALTSAPRSASMGESVVGSSLRVQGLNEQGGDGVTGGPPGDNEEAHYYANQVLWMWLSGPNMTWEEFVSGPFYDYMTLMHATNWIGFVLSIVMAQLSAWESPAGPPQTGDELYGQSPKWNQVGMNQSKQNNNNNYNYNSR